MWEIWVCIKYNAIIVHLPSTCVVYTIRLFEHRRVFNIYILIYYLTRLYIVQLLFVVPDCAKNQE